MFLQNVRSGTPLYIYMTTSLTWTIKVPITTPAWTSVDAEKMVVKVTNDQVTSVALPESLRQSGTAKDTKVVRVVADGNIVIYGGNQQINSGDSYLVYPITSLERTYVIATFESISLVSTVYQPLFGIAAVYDDTEVIITFKTNDLITTGGISKREVPRGVRNSKVRRQDKFRKDWSRH